MRAYYVADASWQSLRRARAQPRVPALAGDPTLAARARHGPGTPRPDARPVRPAGGGLVGGRARRARADPARARSPGAHRSDDDLAGAADARGEGPGRAGRRRG